jgi:antitoxin (DNA-binding transcriptional repressor) of toxin-antitoxin stability system
MLAKEAVMAGNAAEQFNIHEAKTNLSRIIERVERGEEIIISRAGHPVAKGEPTAPGAARCVACSRSIRLGIPMRPMRR